jgi:hypothetical protein
MGSKKPRVFPLAVEVVMTNILPVDRAVEHLGLCAYNCRIPPRSRGTRAVSGSMRTESPVRRLSAGDGALMDDAVTIVGQVGNASGLQGRGAGVQALRT